MANFLRGHTQQIPFPSADRVQCVHMASVAEESGFFSIQRMSKPTTYKRGDIVRMKIADQMVMVIDVIESVGGMTYYDIRNNQYGIHTVREFELELPENGLRS